MMHIKEIAREQGYVSTLFGRRRWIPELQARNSALRGAGERMAINMPIQGTAADIVKIAMIRLYERLRDVRARGARMLLQVHDELLLEVPRVGADGDRADRPRGDGERCHAGCAARPGREDGRRLGVPQADCRRADLRGLDLRHSARRAAWYTLRTAKTSRISRSASLKNSDRYALSDSAETVK